MKNIGKVLGLLVGVVLLLFILALLNFSMFI